MNEIKTLGQLKDAGYVSKSVKQEIRDNLITKLRKNEEIFNGLSGYDNTVIPDMERALLARHNILLLGLRGQAKTRIARQMTDLLDEYIPRSEEHASELQSRGHLVCRLLLEKKTSYAL